MLKFVGLGAEIYSYLIDDSSEDKKAQKNCFIKRIFKFEKCKNCLEATQLEDKISHLEKK